MNILLDNFSDDEVQTAGAEYFDQKESTMGRPTISDAELLGRRDHFVWFLSIAWPDIGWQLPKAIDPEKLRTALAPISKRKGADLISLFLHQSSVPTKATELTKLRKELRRIVNRIAPVVN